MKKLIAVIIINMLLLVNCKKNTPQPLAASPAPPPATQNVATLTPTENCLVGLWYFEKQESISNNSVYATSTYSGNPSFNTITFTGSLSATSTQDPAAYPNFKAFSRVQNGNPYSGLCWKVAATGNLLLSTSQISTLMIDSLTATRFVYTDATGYPNIVIGTRYFLHK